MMKKSIKQLLCLAAAGCLGVSASFAVTYDTYAPLADFTAGGTASKKVAISTNSSGTLTLALGAQQRYNNPAISDNGAGTYYATTGENYGAVGQNVANPPEYKFLGSTWNFDFYIGGSAINDYDYVVSYSMIGDPSLYSFDPRDDADTDDFTPGTIQDSQNLKFANFGTGAINNFTTFDPNLDATYNFLLTATPKTGGTVLESGITVIVGRGSSVPDTGSTLALMSVAFAGIAGLRRKFRV